MTAQVPSRLALLSVTDKNDIAVMARFLQSRHYIILSTGGTGKVLASANIPFVEVSTFTGFPEMFDGRVKTLDPHIFGPMLARMGVPADKAKMDELGWPTIDVVVVNLYQFAQTIAKPGISKEEAIEQIDIGGPSLLRAAAKNHDRVLVVPHVDDYKLVYGNMDANGNTGLSFRQRQAAKTFRLTAQYDTVIADYTEPWIVE